MLLALAGVVAGPAMDGAGTLMANAVTAGLTASPSLRPPVERDTLPLAHTDPYELKPQEPGPLNRETSANRRPL